MNNFYEETKTIRAYDVDFNNRLKINSILNFLQDVASVHADSLQLGYLHLLKHDLAWVLSWIRLEIDHYPSFGDNIILKTWPKCKHKLYSMRDFLIRDEDDRVLVKATTAWLPINIKTKRITDTKNLPQEINYQPDDIALNEFPEKIFSGDKKETLLIKKFRYTDIDVNKHVNNTRYIEMILDSYSTEHHKNNLIRSMAASFLSESFYDDEVEICRSVKNGVDIIEGINIKISRTVFAAQIEWFS